MTRTYNYKPYNSLSNTIEQILTDQEKAAYVIEQFLALTYLPIEDLEVNRYQSNKVYLPTKKLKFKRFNSVLYTNPGNVSLWTGLDSVSARIFKLKDDFAKLGVVQIEDENSLRLDVAKELELHSYAKITGKLTLITPCAVVFLLLTSKTVEAKRFKSFIGEKYPKTSYYGPKLFATIKSKEIANV